MEEEDPPPPPPSLRAPPALPDELVEEVLLRSPPDDPARLVRAALVCKRWSRLVSARAFRRRFRDFHLQRRGAPMLGFLRNERARNYALSARFVRTSASCPRIDTQRGWFALDARGGRVLLHRTDEDTGHMLSADVLFDSIDAASPGIRLAVWDPLSAAAAGGHLKVPVPILPWPPRSWNAALLCSDQHGLQDHADGPFRVVLLVMGPSRTFVCVYSSGPASWSEPAYAAQHLDHDFVNAVPGALVGNALYFLFQEKTSILKYDLAMGDLSVIPLPPAAYSYIRWMKPMVLTTTEDGGLGFAGVVGYRFHLWSMVLRTIGGALAMEFTQCRRIDLSRLLPKIVLLGFVEDAGIILLATNDGLISVDQKSGRTDKLRDGGDFYSDNCIVPFLSFYTPALVTASTDEGPNEDA